MKSLYHKIANSKAWLVVAILLLVAINWGGSFFHASIDFTNEKRFTLSGSTQSILTNLDSTVNITVLLSGDIKSEFKKLSNSTRELLENFKNYGGNNIQYTFEIPGDGLDDSAKSKVFESLIEMGLRPTNQQVQVKEGEGVNNRQIFPGAIVQYKGKTIAVDLLQGQVQKSVFNSSDLLDKKSLNSAEALLEYKFSHAIQQLTQTRVPMVGYLYGNGEPEYGMLPVNDVFETLGRNFVVDTVNIKLEPVIPREFNTLVIVKPVEKFTDEDKFKLDQYVMNGGNLLFLIDVLYAERDSIQNGDLIAYARDLNLNDLLFRYGVRVNTDLIADKHCDLIPVEVGTVGGQSQQQLLPWPYAPLLQPGSAHGIVKNQADVLGQFVNSIDTVEAAGINKTILLTSSENAYTLATPARIELNSLQTLESTNKYSRKNIPVAVLLEGEFASLYANRVSQIQLDNLHRYGAEFKRACKVPGKIIVVSDADIVINQVSEKIGPLPMGTNKYTKVGYANKDFFLTCTEYLANKDNVLEAKAKDYTLRLLDVKKVEAQRNSWQLINLFLPISFICLFAVLYQWRRKRKYTV
jgi:gliding-associated putative ABC transporter substrate-binding component GldG